MTLLLSLIREIMTLLVKRLTILQTYFSIAPPLCKRFLIHIHSVFQLNFIFIRCLYFFQKKGCIS